MADHIGTQLFADHSLQTASRLEFKADAEGKLTTSLRAPFGIDRFVEVVRNRFSAEQKRANRAGFDAYIEAMKQVNQEIGLKLGEELHSVRDSGKPLSMRAVQRVLADQHHGDMLSKLKTQAMSTISTIKVHGENWPNAVPESQFKALRQALEVMQLHLSGTADTQAKIALSSLTHELDKLTGNISHEWIVPEAKLSKRGQANVQVYHCKLNRMVEAPVTNAQWRDMLKAHKLLQEGKEPRNAKTVKATALAVIAATGQKSGLRFLESAPLPALVDLARQIGLGIYTEVDVLHQIQHDMDSKLLDPESLKLLHDFNLSSPIERSKVVLAPDQPQVAGLKASDAKRSTGAESDDPAVKETPKEIRNLRGLFAECLSPTDPSKIETQSPELRAKQACIDNAAALLPLIALHNADEGLRNESIADLAQDSQIPDPVLQALLELVKGQWAIDLAKDGSSGEAEKLRLIESALNDIPVDAFKTLSQATDQSLAEFKAPVRLAFELLSEGFEGIPGNLANFLSQAFRSYFEHQSPLDQRTMLASYMRRSVPESTEVMKLAALVAGGGPYMIKMLQLVGDNVKGEHEKAMKEALAFVKSGLPPIAPSIRDAMLLGIVKDSHGKITALKDVRSLGAASVGETFLANVEKSDGSSEMVVVKLLRPGIAERAGRERQFMDAVAEKLPGMQGTFAGIADQIEAEMDLRSEAANVRLGEVYDHRGESYVQSMKLSATVPAKSNYMMIERAPGSTLAHYIEHLERHSDRTPIHPYVLATRMGLMMNALAEKWVEEAIFGTGFYHGDLHAGNIMFKADEGDNQGTLTVIDFGNSKVLGEIERRSVFRMMCTAHLKSPVAFCKDFEAILSPEGRLQMTDEKRREFLAKITEAFNKTDPQTGEAFSTGQIIDAILTSANNLGLEVPGPIANFSRSEMMLENTFKKITAQAHSNLESFRSLREHDPELKQEVEIRTKNLTKALDRRLNALIKREPMPTAEIERLKQLKAILSEDPNGFEALETDDIDFMLGLEDQLRVQERSLTPAINRLKQTYAIKRDLASIPDEAPTFAIEQAIAEVFKRNQSAVLKLSGLGLVGEVIRG